MNYSVYGLSIAGFILYTLLVVVAVITSAYYRNKPHDQKHSFPMAVGAAIFMVGLACMMLLPRLLEGFSNLWTLIGFVLACVMALDMIWAGIKVSYKDWKLDGTTTQKIDKFASICVSGVLEELALIFALFVLQ
jgi:hypothetical protein